MEDESNSKNPFMLTDKAYDILKQVALVFLPALGTLYFMLGQAWEWNNVAQVVGTITAIDTFLGAILGVSTKAYNNSGAKYDGVMVSEISEAGKKVYSLELNNDPETLDAKNSVTFKVE